MRAFTVLLLFAIALPARADRIAELEYHLPGASDLCLLPPHDTARSPAQATLLSLLDALERLESQPNPLLATLRATDVALCLEPRTTEARGVLDVDAGLIALDADLAPGAKMAILIHELRHLDQFTRGFCPGTKLSMKANAAFTFALEADAQAISTLLSWGLKARGNGAAWEFLMSDVEVADITARFAAAMDKDAGIAVATSAAFDQWYASPERVERYYIASCTDYLDRQDEQNLIPSDLPLPSGVLAPLCRLPDGSAYPCTPRTSPRD